MQRKRPRYPIWILSKGRWDRCLTAKTLLKDEVDFTLVVERPELEKYREHLPDAKYVVLPERATGKGAVAVRNWIWEQAVESGAERHWVLDDNIECFKRRYKAKRMIVDGGIALRTCEDFTDRYENVAISGLNYTMFVPDRRKYPPFNVNVHVYSCMLIRNDLEYRWRGQWNSDTDLCLQVLSGGWCTILINAFLAAKIGTMQMKGGNTERYFNDGRLKMARSLERQWPGVVTTARRFNRPQHVIKDAWRKFDTPLKLKPEIDLDQLDRVDEYGMEVVQVASEVKSERIRRLAEDHRQRYSGEKS